MKNTATLLCALLACIFAASARAELHGRKLKFIDIDCCKNGFQFNSSFLTIDIKKGAVDIESPLGSASFSADGVVIDSPLLQINTTETVRVEVAGGRVLNITTAEDGNLELTIGKDGAVATVVIDERGRGIARGGQDNAIIVDFLDPSGAVRVDVGKGGKIVEVRTDGEGNAVAKVVKKKRLAVIDVSGDGVDIEVFGRKVRRGKKGKKSSRKKGVSEGAEGEKTPIVSVSGDGLSIVEKGGDGAENEALAHVMLMGADIKGITVEEV